MIKTDHVAQAGSWLTQKMNLIVLQAIAKHAGDPSPNPYVYVNRMSKQEEQSGTTIFLDGKPICFIGKPSSSPTEIGFDLKLPHAIY